MRHLETHSGATVPDLDKYRVGAWQARFGNLHFGGPGTYALGAGTGHRWAMEFTVTRVPSTRQEGRDVEIRSDGSGAGPADAVIACRFSEARCGSWPS
jgi:hypothetical protein